MFAMGVTMYGQMTAGSYCYIGPQGIVHGTTVSDPNLFVFLFFVRSAVYIILSFNLFQDNSFECWKKISWNKRFGRKGLYF